jgi:hypothetical protein
MPAKCDLRERARIQAKLFQRGKCIPEIEREQQESECPGFFYTVVREHR